MKKMTKNKANDNILSVGMYEQFRQLCHGVKSGNTKAVNEAAFLLSGITPSNATLVPIPSHYGRTTYTLELAKQIAKLTGCMVDDCLAGPERETLYSLKYRGILTDLGMALLHNPNGNIYLLDNVIDTGHTYRASSRLVGNVPIITIAKTLNYQ